MGVCAPFLSGLNGNTLKDPNSTACGDAKAAADAAVQSGNAAVEAAQGQLDLLRRGGAPATLAAVQAQVASAQALVKATACELVAQTKEPLSRQSLADVTGRVRRALGKPISRSTVWRILDSDAIKPWQYKYWIFPRDPHFVEKAGPILDLYAGCWQGQPLGPKDSILKRRREDEHPGAGADPPASGLRAWPAHPRRARVPAGWSLAVPGGLGCPPRLRDGAVRGQDRDRPVRPLGGASPDPGAVSHGGAAVLGGR